MILIYIKKISNSQQSEGISKSTKFFIELIKFFYFIFSYPE
jgi:hypothetical protein